MPWEFHGNPRHVDVAFHQNIGSKLIRLNTDERYNNNEYEWDINNRIPIVSGYDRRVKETRCNGELINNRNESTISGFGGS